MNTRDKRSLGAPLALVVASAVILSAEPAAAHGLAGKRFFPATLATEDPFVADELSLPTIESRRMPAEGDEPATRETGFSLDVSKRITENLGIGFGATYKVLEPDGGDKQRGFDNLAASIKYKFYQDDARETILSAGVDWDIGGSGSKRVGAESFSTLTPALFFGRGFGDLPESMKFLRPLAVTGLVGTITARAEAQVLRLSMLYALLDGKSRVDLPHLEAVERHGPGDQQVAAGEGRPHRVGEHRHRPVEAGARADDQETDPDQ